MEEFKPEDYMTRKEAKELLGISTQRLQQLLAENKLDSVRIGYRRLVSRASVAARIKFINTVG